MSEYNPRRPFILGDEWVGIRDENIQFTNGTNDIEYGYRFSLATPQVLESGRFYVDDQLVTSSGQHALVSLYPYTQVDNSGPIRKVIIPCNNAAITGSPTMNSNGVDSLGAIDSLGVSAQAFTPPVFQANFLRMNFATLPYMPLLNGKRILSIRLIVMGYQYNNLVTLTQFTSLATLSPSVSNLSLRSEDPAAGSGRSFGDITPYLPNGSSFSAGGTGYIPLGNLGVPVATSGVRSWTGAELARFDLANPGTHFYMHIAFNLPDNSGQIFLNYVALEVMYCEEQRIAIGLRGFPSQTPGFGMNYATMTDMNYNVLPVIPAGDYFVSLTTPDEGVSIFADKSTFPKMNALRELYSIPTMPGQVLNIPYPSYDHEGEVMSAAGTHIIPQLTLHTTGGPINESQVYGRQIAAQVWGGNTASQRIDATSGGTYPQVRYYARRYGDTTIPLLLSSPDITGAGNTVSLTPAQWDVLPEIIDRWKEITLRFPTPPVFTVGQPRWTWSATGELAGNRWEVLGLSAPAISGVASTRLLKVPPPHQLSSATYGMPTNGAVVDLDWMYGYDPLVSGTTDDPTVDAPLMFSLDPPAITGFAVNLTTQAVTGFAECGHGPCCIPSAIGYNRITWSPTSYPATGFGSYELQRFDAIEASWKTIMLGTNVAVTGFNDYEARVGVSSSYQMRQNNILNFNGPWSVTGSTTLAEPGVTMPACGTSKRGVLIFTSNEAQNGSRNLAYAMTFDDEIVEDFSFPEAGQVQINTYLDRDYQIAFHGTERGGEVFSRTLLLTNAAIPLPRLANVRSLRDLAWADLAYVCVRDDIGDRWLATVIVPNDAVRRNRRLYNAQITVVEVTTTPTPVNP